MIIKKTILLLLLITLLCSCSGVKPYQKMYLNSEDMALSTMKAKQYEINSQNYREGATGANGSKTGGGCGCN